MSVVRSIQKNGILNKIHKYSEFAHRGLLPSKYKVFYPYAATLLHPTFRYIVKNPPVKYVNYSDASLIHTVNGPNDRDLHAKKNYIVECYDQIFSIAFENDPCKCLAKTNYVRDLLSSSACKKIILLSSGHKTFTVKYFNSFDITDKIQILHTPLPRKYANTGPEQNKKFSDDLVFLAIASGYYIKGMDFVVKAWREFSLNVKGVKLIIVCHDMPESEKKTLQCVDYVNKIPLTDKDKDLLYKSADVVIAPVLTDGMGVGMEALSYGKPLVTYRATGSSDLIENSNGFIIDLPVNFYDEGYGKEWGTFSEWLKILEKRRNEGAFDKTCATIYEKYMYYYSNRESIKIQGMRSSSLFEKNHTIEKRNSILKNIYLDFLK